MNNARQLAVITGGSGYVGSAIMHEFESNGWIVADLSRSSAAFPCDITDETQVRDAIQKIVAAHGNISACVHAAARVDSESDDVIVAVALSGAQNLADAALPYMEGGGAFIGITTQLIEKGVSAPDTGAYSASKQVLREFLRDLAKREKRIRVYAVAPGYLPGGLNKDVPKAVIEFLAKKTSKRPHSVENVAQLVVRIAQKKSEYPSSTSILVDGEVVTPL